MIDIYRVYTTLHHALVPYTYQHALEAGARAGRSPSRWCSTMPDDPRVGDLWQEYLYGDDILVAPIWHVGQTTQHVYLPAGHGSTIGTATGLGDRPVDLDEPAPLDRIPIFVRAGAKVLATF